ncbi:MAG: hypothetical protein KJ757_03170 [Planctomycetes bacterium]|nr:hypothetical protein [Planctomycetota bacterium]MBU1517746.1 hypothetical protein [Planctomycetota bacterium]MBU2457838.1 hypothetical protein [Planctomycetota bacterium]MBU2596551.1 hypothetical protein [Planctomycetota bacterium]
MKLPGIKNPDKYVDLYVVDFGDHSGVGFTADEVAELVESEKFKDVKVYRIYKAYLDGRMELKGVPNGIFELEAGMFFYESDETIARGDYKRLTDCAVKTAPPGRAKVHLAKYNDEKFATVLIFPAEYNDQFGRWLLDIDYKTQGAAEGGIEAVKRYYADKPEILERYQLFEQRQIESLTGAELLAATKTAVVR